MNGSFFLREIRQVAFGLARYSDHSHTNDSFVLFSSEKIPSKRGVKHPLDPLLFTFVLQGCTAEGLALSHGPGAPLYIAALPSTMALFAA